MHVHTHIYTPTYTHTHVCLQNCMHMSYTHTHTCLQDCMGVSHTHTSASSPAAAILHQGWTHSLVKVGGAQTTSWPWLQACSRPLRWTQPLTLRPRVVPALLSSLFSLPGMEPNMVSNHRSIHPIQTCHRASFRASIQVLLSRPSSFNPAPSPVSPRSSLQELLKAGCGPLLAPLAGEEHCFLWGLQELHLRLCWFLAGSTLPARNPSSASPPP